MIEAEEAVARPPEPFRSSSLWSVAVIVCALCAVTAIGIAGWYYFAASSASKKIATLNTDLASLDQSFSEANKLTVNNVQTTVQARVHDLLLAVQAYHKILQGHRAWDKILPAISNQTLQGLTLNGLSVDDKLAVKLDGIANESTIGSNKYTPFGMVARQVVAYQDAEFTPDVSSTLSGSKAPAVVTKEKVFSNVKLSSISNSGGGDANSGPTKAKFSITMTLNPKIVEIKTQDVTTSTSTSAPSGTGTSTGGVTP